MWKIWGKKVFYRKYDVIFFILWFPGSWLAHPGNPGFSGNHSFVSDYRHIHLLQETEMVRRLYSHCASRLSLFHHNFFKIFDSKRYAKVKLVLSPGWKRHSTQTFLNPSCLVIGPGHRYNKNRTQSQPSQLNLKCNNLKKNGVRLCCVAQNTENTDHIVSIFLWNCFILPKTKSPQRQNHPFSVYYTFTYSVKYQNKNKSLMLMTQSLWIVFLKNPVLLFKCIYCCGALYTTN